MTELQRYLAEEVADDHADGVITRREAMRGVAGSAAVLLLDAGAARASARGRHGVEHGPTTTEWAVVSTEAITFPGPNGTLLGAWAPAVHARGGVLVIHENRGLNDHIRSVAGRLAAVGYSAIAIDLLSEEGGTDALPDDAARSAALAAAPPEASTPT
jgi:carboxymethylenebutenolidase